MILNENSRQGTTRASAALEVFERCNMQLRMATCESPADLAKAIRKAAGSVDLVVIGGGDGTLNAAALALYETGLPMGILPFGTANDLARTLGIPNDPALAAETIVAGNIRRIDLGQVNGKPFFNVATIGIGARVTSELTTEVKQSWGKLGYAMATLRALRNSRPFFAEIRTEGGAVRVWTYQISVGNGRHYGGGMTVEEGADIDDGLLDLFSLEFNRLWVLAFVYPAFRKGRHGKWGKVRTMSGREFEVRTHRPRSINTDGEISTNTPAHFRILPGAVSVLAPVKAVATT